jgi:hypothetical protein
MKNLLRALPFTFCLLASAADPARPPIMQIGELPGEKNPDLLRPKERNPFTRRETKIAEIASEKETEESRLRELFKTMPVTGIIRGGGTVKVLLQSLILKEGQPLPPMIKDQTEQLFVAQINAKQLEIDFVESEAHAEPRKIIIPIDLHPHVSVRIFQAADSSGSIRAGSGNSTPGTQ